MQAAPTLGKIDSHHLRGLLVMLTDVSQLGSGLKQVVRTNQEVSIEGITGYEQVRPVANLILNGKSAPIESMGLVRLDGNQAKPSCQLYRLYFRLAVGREGIRSIS
ncbi:MAG: hypothetical protein F6J90_27955 [Moorea sp. SIOASIH]|uniref:AAA-like domain-containing protein n=1 Tax=Moorena sp. SIOASIH TaxID=2607817 RepID=UPI0013BB6C12|nr:AAA-like domain-containing protein [Moorena sp. SIOASIH]NEO39961.1 hypothetical protein [Moorena sp. SIOASIH]